MRAALLDAWPALAHHFPGGPQPHNFHLYSEAELTRYVDALEQINREAEEARRRAR